MKNGDFRSAKQKKSANGDFFKILFLVLLLMGIAFLIQMTENESAHSTSSSSETVTVSPETTTATESVPSIKTIATTSTETTSHAETTTVTTETVATTVVTTMSTTTSAVETTTTAPETTTVPITDEEMDELIVKKYLTVNPYSRVGDKRSSTKYIVVHYTANPGTGADNNWSYFNGLAVSKQTSVSSNFIIGLDGKIIQCMPLDEVAYANAPLNYDSISIECCHPDSTGKFTQATYDSLVKLVSWLCHKYGLDEGDVIRHYDVTGKMCPLYWAGDKGSDAYNRWMNFKKDILIY